MNKRGRIIYAINVNCMSDRVIEIDILKGIGMLMVIIGHSFHVWPIYEFFNCVHMPLFFLVSGYFFSLNGDWGG